MAMKDGQILAQGRNENKQGLKGKLAGPEKKISKNIFSGWELGGGIPHELVKAKFETKK
jgi:hypothetical protein